MTDIRLSDPNGTSIYDSLSAKPKKANAPAKVNTADDKVNNTITKDKSTIEKTEGKDSVKNNVDFVDKKEDDAIESASETSTDNSTNSSQPADSGKIAGLTDPKTGELRKLKVDAGGHPVLGADGQLQDDPNGKHVYVRVDDKNKIILNDKGEPSFINADGQDQPPMPQEVAKAMSAMTAHSTLKAITQVVYKPALTKTVKAVAQKMISGGHIAIPFTEKSLGFGVKHAVAKAVSAEVKSIKAVKAGSTTVVAALKGAEKTAAGGAVKTLTKSGTLGKGVETLSMKEAAAAFKKPATNIVEKAVSKISPVPTVLAVKESAKALERTVVKEVTEKGVVRGSKTIVEKAIVGAGESAIKKGVEKGVEKGVKAAIKKGGVELAEKVTTKAVEKALIQTTEKAAVKAATTGAAKAGGKLASAVPVIGAVAGLAITAWDAKDAYDKTRDPKVGKASTALAWTTVGLDVISTAATATGIGAPIGWIATGLSLGTGFLSDYLK